MWSFAPFSGRLASSRSFCDHDPVKSLEPPDTHHLSAAIGWLGLGNHLEANEELEKITPTLRTHPDVLEARLEIYSRAKKWEACVDIGNALVQLAPNRSSGWLQRSLALYFLKRIQEAYDQSLPAAGKFPKAWPIPYNLACYCAQLGRLEECKEWLNKAMAIDEKSVKRAAIDDPDMQPLWDSLGGTAWKGTE